MTMRRKQGGRGIYRQSARRQYDKFKRKEAQASVEVRREVGRGWEKEKEKRRDGCTQKIKRKSEFIEASTVN